MKRTVRVVVLGGIALLGSALMAAQQGPVSLGEVARQQKAEKKAKRVITNDDIPSRPPEAARAGGASVAQAAGATSGEGANGGAAAPKVVPADVQKRVDELKGNEEGQKRVINKFLEGLKEENLSDFRRRMYEDGLVKAKEMLEGYSRQRIALEEAMSAAAPESAAQPPQQKEKESAVEPTVIR